MTRLIDADELYTVLVKMNDFGELSAKKAVRMVSKAPTVDAVPVRHGQWLSREEGAVYPFWERYTCSVCGKHADDTEYCPHCGARMVEE